jgi:T-complex protein 1 subunit eta
VLNIELELKSERDNAEVRLTDPTQYQSIVDAEWNIIYAKLDACIATGAKIILSRLPIGDLATQYFADRDVFCAGRVEVRARWVTPRARWVDAKSSLGGR